MAVDPITLEIVQGTVESARKEMELQVERTARSIIIRERRDYRAAVFNKDGANVSSASSAALIDPIRNTYGDDVHEGDVFLWNDPFKSVGGITHLPDLCVTQPVFWQGKIAGYTQVFGHVLDVGGIVPGSIAIGATDIFQEGLIVPPVKLFSKGVRNEDLYRTVINNTRFPDDLRGDLDAEVMACGIGVRRIQGLLELYGAETVEAALEEVLEACARALRERVLPLVPEGTFEFEDFVEINGAVPQEPRKFIRLRVAMHKREDGKLEFDFSGTDKQSPAAINIAGTAPYYVKYLMSIFKPWVPDVILNSGALRVLDVKLERGTVLQANYPASSSYRAVSLFRVPDICMGALAKAMGGYGAGASDTRSPWRYSGVYEGRPFLLHDGVGAGGGGKPVGDGPDAVHGGVNSTSVPAEYIEATYPVRIDEYGLARDSGGPGKRRGGMGIHKECTFLAPGSLWIFADRQALQPWGIGGGNAGEGTVFALNLGKDNVQNIDYKATNIKVSPGDVLTIRTPGGGGWGDPLTREVDLVLHDLNLDLITASSARDRYGVVVEDGIVNGEKTAALRSDLAGKRGPLAMVDRGTRFHTRRDAGDLHLTTSDTEPEVTAQ